jgi:hypothetical protein
VLLLCVSCTGPACCCSVLKYPDWVYSVVARGGLLLVASGPEVHVHDLPTGKLVRKVSCLAVCLAGAVLTDAVPAELGCLQLALSLIRHGLLAVVGAVLVQHASTLLATPLCFAPVSAHTTSVTLPRGVSPYTRRSACTLLPPSEAHLLAPAASHQNLLSSLPPGPWSAPLPPAVPEPA